MSMPFVWKINGLPKPTPVALIFVIVKPGDMELVSMLGSVPTKLPAAKFVSPEPLPLVVSNEIVFVAEAKLG